MQNTIIKEFADDPRVFVAAFQQGGAHGETRDWLEIFWAAHHLGGPLIWDESGTVGSQLYGQPATGLPFGRGFIIDQEGRVTVPYFGHRPGMVIDTIHAMLALTGSDDAPPAPAGSIGVSTYPNPFNPRGIVVVDLAHAATVRVEIVDLRGRLVRVLKHGVSEAAGRHELVWDGTDALGRAQASGAYLVRVSTERTSAARSLTLVR